MNIEQNSAVSEFMDEIQEKEILDIDYTIIRDACEEVRQELQKFPDPYSMASLDPAYDERKVEFYNNYIGFARACSKVLKTLTPGTGDFRRYKIYTMLKGIDNNFPYGWRPYRMIRNESVFPKTLKKMSEKAENIADELSEFLDMTARFDDLGEYFDEYDLKALGDSMDALYFFAQAASTDSTK